MGKDNTMNYEPDCDNCKELEKERTMLDAYRKFFKDDMNEVLNNRLGNHDNLTKSVNRVEKWMWKIEIKGGTVYLLTVAVVLIIIYLLVERGFISWIINLFLL